MYALIQNGSVAQYPYSFAQLKRDNPNVSFPRQPTDAALAEWGVLPVAAVTPPAHNALTHWVAEGLPALVGDEWRQTWSIQALTPAEAAQKRQELQDSIVGATQARLDAFAQTRGYDGILSACTYATSSVPKFQAEGQYCVDARDATWSALYTMLAEVQAGARPVPGGFEDIEPDLPALQWPV